MNACRTFALFVAAAALVAASAGRAQEAPATPSRTRSSAGRTPTKAARRCAASTARTYVGWRTFHGICHTCHAQDAVGSTFAPDLLVRMRQIDKAEFMKALAEGFKGQVGVMPPWSQDPNVSKYFEELWSYLKARSDGVLLPGRPKRLPAEP